MEHKNWSGFKSGVWQNEINVRDFIQKNYNCTCSTLIPMRRRSSIPSVEW